MGEALAAFLRLYSLVMLGPLILGGCGPQGALMPTVLTGGLNAREIAAPSVAQTVSPEASATIGASTAVEGEGVLKLRARVPEGSWARRQREAVTLRLWLDGVYSQDIVLYGGDREHVYAVSLGALSAGPHTLRFDWFAPGSAQQLNSAHILEAELNVVAAGSPNYEVLRRAPIVYGRPDAHVSDTPILMMYEQYEGPTGRTVRYTPVFSNEDGGTPTKALWARWGRTLDIDWCYEVETNPQGQAVRETYQGQWHRTRTFRGRHEQAHPVLRVATDNNCFHDRGETLFRFRPLPSFHWQPERMAREEILDRNPWSYALSAAELVRESKAVVDQETHAPPKKNLAGDSRRYLIVEFNQVNRGRGVGIAVTLKGDPAQYHSNSHQQNLQASRTGWCRVAVELPRHIEANEIQSIALCGKGRGEADITGVRKVLTFNRNCEPIPLPIRDIGPATLKKDADRLYLYGPEGPTSALNRATGL